MGCGPRRIVCLTAETVDLLYRLGVEDRIVGVSGYTVFPPEARTKPFVSAFTTIRYDVIDTLKPDLILGFSDLQADAARELVSRGYPVLMTNQRTLEETFEALVLVGRSVGRGTAAEEVVADLKRRVAAARSASRCVVSRPRVYFEEWDDPLITGLPWVSDLVEAAGGEEAFPEFRRCATAAQRTVQAAAVVERAPDIIIASWCGRKASLAAIRSRPGWDTIPAVRDHHVYEMKSAYCLQPGPTFITDGLPRFAAIIGGWKNATNRPLGSVN